MIEKVFRKILAILLLYKKLGPYMPDTFYEKVSKNELPLDQKYETFNQ
ncbi:hypothetical protein V7200_00805 [Cytobacillus firmus]|nr:hypothetical protein [Cytobacillus firmus]MDD9312158.1 hypothetical protein [Cytobacillus firmus]